MILEEDEIFLEHFGVKGMKWGVRKEDRAAGKQARRDSKATKREKNSSRLQEQIDTIDNTSYKKGSFKSARAHKKRIELLEEKRIEDKAAKDIRSGKLTDRQRKVVKGAVIAGGIVAAYGAYHMVQSGEANRLIMKGSAFVRRSDILNKNDALSRKMSVNDIFASVVIPTNPGFGGTGTTVNCRRCTFAYEMRRRGYDVVATRTTNSRGQDISGLYNSMNPGGNRIRSGPLGIISEVVEETYRSNKSGGGTPFTDSVKAWTSYGTNKINPSNGEAPSAGDIFSALRKNPHGARGELGVGWRVGGGHSLAWEIVGGKPVIFDAQTGRKYLSPENLIKEFGPSALSGAGFTRLDNVTLDEDFLLRWVKNA